MLSHVKGGASGPKCDPPVGGVPVLVKKNEHLQSKSKQTNTDLITIGQEGQSPSHSAAE